MFQTGKNEAAKMDCDVEDKLPTIHQQESNISNENANEISGEDFSKSATKYRCDLCQKDFSLKGTWKRHMERIHVPSEKVKCKKCDTITLPYYIFEQLLKYFVFYILID